MQTIIISRGNQQVREEHATNHIEELLGNFSNHPDLDIIQVDEGKQRISIERARELIKLVHIKPRNSKSKVIWIKEAHALTNEAQNSLLKILEEPPEYARIILTVDHHENLIETIRSRCQLIEISHKGESSSNFGESSVPLVDSEQLVLDLIRMLDLKTGARIDWVTENKSVIADRSNTTNILSVWITALRDLMLLSESSSNLESRTNLKIVNDNLMNELTDLAKTKSAQIWAGKIELAQKIRGGVQKNNANTSLAIEAFLVNL